MIIISPSATTTDFGVGVASVIAKMKDYPTIASLPISFNVTILGSSVPSVQNQTYIQGSSPLVIDYGLFKVMPQDFDVGPS